MYIHIYTTIVTVPVGDPATSEDAWRSHTGLSREAIDFVRKSLRDEKVLMRPTAKELLRHEFITRTMKTEPIKE